MTSDYFLILSTGTMVMPRTPIANSDLEEAKETEAGVDASFLPPG